MSDEKKLYWLRFEGVNQANFIYDTQDLSTVRGGGLILLDGVEWLKDKVTSIVGASSLETVSTGASSGLFRFCADGNTAKDLPGTLRTFIAGHAKLKHATVAIDIVADEGFKTSKEKLLAANRWQQMEAPSAAFPSLSSGPTIGKGVCRVDFVRPAARRCGKKKGKVASESVFVRRGYGIGAKKTFYVRELGRLKRAGQTNPAQGMGFAWNLEQIAKAPEAGSLSGKMAVIYVDGNDFGKIEKGCASETALSGWDKHIKTRRREFLWLLLEKIKSDPRWLNGEKVRLETLLWGGDDILWVVPAWVGWEMLAMFFESAKAWEFNKTLTHGAGLVFCHHNAPIHRVKDLAKSLAEVCKNSPGGRGRNLAAYVALESFDHAGLDLERFNKIRFGGRFGWSDVLVHGVDMANWSEHFRVIKEELPRRRVWRGVRDILAGATVDDASFNKGLDTKAVNALGEFKKLTGAAGRPEVWLLHLAELWDYVSPEWG